MVIAMNQVKDFTDVLSQTVKVTRGRISERDVFRDFIVLSALQISALTDPVHPKRTKLLGKLLESYEKAEQDALFHTFHKLVQTITQNTETGIYQDLFNVPYMECCTVKHSLKQDFSPSGVGNLIGQLVFEGHPELQPEGYMTLNDPTCGSGTLLLEAVGRFASKGFNPSEQLVIQASDVDAYCAQMTYIQLSLYGIPAVVIQGEVIAMEEYDRWYTPAYLWGKWVWRAPMPFGTARNRSDELLKMLDDPMYAACRQMDRFIRTGGKKHEQ